MGDTGSGSTALFSFGKGGTVKVNSIFCRICVKAGRHLDFVPDRECLSPQPYAGAALSLLSILEAIYVAMGVSRSDMAVLSSEVSPGSFR